MRITAGEFRSRTLKTLAGDNTRPTQDKVKEAVFSRVGPYFEKGIILDLFAGSGAVGLEALSRGYDQAVFVDSSHQAVEVIRENVRALHVEQRCEILSCDYRTAMKQLSDRGCRFDMIFMDPPYRFHLGSELIRMVHDLKLLKDDGIMIYESDASEEIKTEYFDIVKQAKYSQSLITYLERKEVMTKAIYPGSFDPITIGHLDIIERGARLYDELVVVIMPNDEKQGLFSYEERLEMIREATSHLDNVSAEIGYGLTVDFAKKTGAKVLLRGIRAITDYEHEMQLATANMHLDPEIETVILVAKPEYSFLSSSTAKTIAANHGDFSDFVPESVEKRMLEKYR